jgi:hypothetical protein
VPNQRLEHTLHSFYYSVNPCDTDTEAVIASSDPEAHSMQQQHSKMKAVWLDCDPGAGTTYNSFQPETHLTIFKYSLVVFWTGHDDALAILLAGYHPDIQLLGISTVASNQVSLHTASLTLIKCSRSACKMAVVL